MPDIYLWDVFLSYSSCDKLRVQQLAERLRAAGLRVWFDAWVIEPGDDIYAAIEHGLEYARTLILCMSQAALASDWIKLERNTTLFRDPQNTARRFIPLLLEDCEVPAVIRRLRAIDWRSASEDEWSRLLNVCQPASPAASVQLSPEPGQVAPPGGAIRHDDPRYIARAVDTAVSAAARRQAETLVLKAPRQMGKSSLLKRYLAESQQAGKRTALLDLALFTDTDLASYATLLTHLAEAFWRRLGQPPEARPEAIPSQAALSDYVEYTLLPAVSGPVVLAFDEADKLLGRDYQADFFSMLRYWHERRTDTPTPAWARVSLALVISTEPYLLIRDAQRSPFNVTVPLEPQPFNEVECLELNRRYASCLSDAEVTQLRALVGGHPYLMRLAYYHLTRQPSLAFATLISYAAERYGPFGLHLRALDKKLRDEADPVLHEAMQRLARGAGGISPAVLDRLHGAGLVHEYQGRVVPANQLYSRFFGGQP